MKKISIFIILVVLILPVFVSASDCKNEDLIKAKKAASNVNATLKQGVIYREQLNADDDTSFMKPITVFDYTLDNVTDDIYILVYNENSLIFDSRNGGINDKQYIYTIDDLSSLQTISLNIYANNNGCKNEFLRNILVNVPKYNNYYYSQACSDIPEFYLCQEFIYTDYNDINGYDEVFKKYKAGEVDKKGDEVEHEKSFLEKLVGIFGASLYGIAGFIVGFFTYRFVRRQLRIKKHLS